MAHATSPDTIQLLVLERREPDLNMARYYVLSIEPSLFGDPTLVREWGRIGHNGRRIIEIHGNEQDAVQALDTWLEQKLRRGYRLKYRDSLCQSFEAD